MKVVQKVASVSQIRGMLAPGGHVPLQKGKLRETLAAICHVSLVPPDGTIKKQIGKLGFYKKSYISSRFGQESRSHFFTYGREFQAYN